MWPDERTFCPVPTCKGDLACALKCPGSQKKGPRAGPPYRWCSACRSSRGYTRTCRRGRFRALRSGGGRPSGRRLPPSSHPRSGRCPPRRRRGHHSQQHRSLWRRGGRKAGQDGQDRENKRLGESLMATGASAGHPLGACERLGFPRTRPWDENSSQAEPVPSTLPHQNRAAGRALLCLRFPLPACPGLRCSPLPKGTGLLNRCEKKSDLLKNWLCVKTN